MLVGIHSSYSVSYFHCPSKAGEHRAIETRGRVHVLNAVVIRDDEIGAIDGSHDSSVG